MIFRLVLIISCFVISVFCITDIVGVEAFKGGKVVFADVSTSDVDTNFITAKAAVVADGETGEILYAKNIAMKTPLASLTKLMSFFVLSEKKLDWDKAVELKKDDFERLVIYVEPDDRVSSLGLQAGSQMTIRDLFFAGLIKSANDAVAPMVRAAGFDPFSFARKMNNQALRFGMDSTRFDEPTGLSVKNVGTAGDLVSLALNVFENKLIRNITSRDSYQFNELTTGRAMTLDSTNKLFQLLEGTSYKIIAGKTGYLDESGYNLLVKIQNDEGKSYIIVVLGSETDESRFRDAYKLLQWADDLQ